MQLDFGDRPWGSWQVLDEAPGYKVKRIRVSGGSRLSYQTHQHREEHWVVVSGVATCTVGQGTRRVLPGQSVDVPQGAAHRIANDELEDPSRAADPSRSPASPRSSSSDTPDPKALS